MLIGDSYYAYASYFYVPGYAIIGGNDTLVGAGTDDEMHGDFVEGDGFAVPGADVFVFAPNNGFDVVWDFGLTQNDKIDVRALKAAFFDADFNGRNDFLNLTQMRNSGRIELIGFDHDDDGDPDDLVDSTIIYTGSVPGDIDSDHIILVGVDPDDLLADDFIFG